MRHFGGERAALYVRAIADAIETLVNGPATPGLRQRPDLPAGVFVLRAPSAQQRGQHVLLIRCRENGPRPSVDVLRILHARMNLPRRLRDGPLANRPPRR